LSERCAASCIARRLAPGAAAADKLDAEIELDAGPDAVPELIANDRDKLETADDDEPAPNPESEPEPDPNPEPEPEPVGEIVLTVPVVPIADAAAGTITGRFQPNA